MHSLLNKFSDCAGFQRLPGTNNFIIALPISVVDCRIRWGMDRLDRRIRCKQPFQPVIIFSRAALFLDVGRRGRGLVSTPNKSEAPYTTHSTHHVRFCFPLPHLATTLAMYAQFSEDHSIPLRQYSAFAIIRRVHFASCYPRSTFKTAGDWGLVGEVQLPGGSGGQGRRKRGWRCSSGG